MSRPASWFNAGPWRLPLGEKTYTVGILNVTPDSFSDGGQYQSTDRAIERAEQLVAQGADILDIGGESTRPGSAAVPAAQEIERVVPVVAALSRRLNVPISVDTWKADVAAAALDAGASIINDVTGLLGDPAMAGVAARSGAGLFLMHNAVLYRPGHPAAVAFINLPHPDESVFAALPGLDLIPAVRRYFSLSCQVAFAAGIDASRLVLDPGIGFGLTTDESLDLMAALPHLQPADDRNLPLLVGPSRKRFIGDILNKPVGERTIGTAAAVAAAIARGADFVRVHDVDPVVQTVRVCDAILRRSCGDVS